MRLSTWIAFGLGVYYLIAGFGYALTSDFVDGFPLLMAAAIGIGLFGAYAYRAVRRAEQAMAAGEEPVEPVEPHIGSTIWPFGYALSAVGLVIGFLAYQPMYAVGGILFVAATAGWFADVRHQWWHSEDEPSAAEMPHGGGPAPATGERIV